EVLHDAALPVIESALNTSRARTFSACEFPTLRRGGMRSLRCTSPLRTPCKECLLGQCLPRGPRSCPVPPCDSLRPGDHEVLRLGTASSGREDADAAGQQASEN